jgi:hypothetical protein
MSKVSQPKVSPQEKQWQVEDAMRTLQRAEQIKSDRGLMAGVKKAAADLQKVVNKSSPKPRSKK